MPEFQSIVLSLILGQAAASGCYPTYHPYARYSVGDAVSQIVTTTTPISYTPCTVSSTCTTGYTQTGGFLASSTHNFVCYSPYLCSSADYAPGGVYSDIAWAKEDAACTADAAVIHAPRYSPSSLSFVGRKEVDEDNYDAKAVKFNIVPFGEDEASSLWGTHSVTQELGGGDDAHEDDGIHGYEIMREKGDGIQTTDGRGGGATTATTDPIEEAAGKAAEPLNRQALVSAHASTYAVIHMADLTDTEDVKSSSADVVGEEDAVIEVEVDVDEENGDGRDSEDDNATVLLTKMVDRGGNYDVDGRHPEIEADPTAIDDVKITSTTTMEVDRGIKDDVASTTTSNVEGGEVENQDDEIVMSATGVVMNGIVVIEESAGSKRKMQHAIGMVEETAKLKQDVR